MGTDEMPPVLVLGDDAPGGVYLLRVGVAEALNLSFGRFKGGKPIPLPAGEYLYIGSARAAGGIASRLVRHATRSGDKPPHRIRERLAEACASLGTGRGRLSPMTGKKLFWNVDHLLDQERAEILNVVIIRTPARLETKLARLLEDNPCTRIVERGLGANDIPGTTHLLRVIAGEDWWRSLPSKLLHAL